jgi:hypothetical protein
MKSTNLEMIMYDFNLAPEDFTKIRRKLPLGVLTELFPTPALLTVLFTESGEPIRTLVPFSALNLITGEKQHDPGGVFAKGWP